MGVGRTVKFEEFRVGQKFETEETLVTQESVLQFASLYDPQCMHLGIRFSGSLFDQTIASGFQTIAIGWGLWIRSGVFGTDGRAGLGMEDVKWHRPVLIGDRLRARVEVVGLNPTSNPSYGVVSKKFEIVNQKGDVVASYLVHSLVAKRGTDP